jgi:hypothetical protein
VEEKFNLLETVRKYHLPDFSNWQLPPLLPAPSPGWKKICAQASANSCHPNGMKSFSPGLRGTSYPGSSSKQNNFNPNGVASAFAAK